MSGLIDTLRDKETGRIFTDERAARIGAITGGPSRREQALGQLETIRSLRAEEQTQAQEMQQKVLSHVLNANLEALKEEADPSRREVLTKNISALSGSLGVDVSSVIGGIAPTPKNTTLSPGAQLIGPDGKVIAENPKPTSGYTLAPQAQRWENGKLVAENKNVRPVGSGSGITARKLNLAEENLRKVLKEEEGSDSMSSAVKIANAKIWYRKAAGEFSTSSAQKARESIETPLVALTKMDKAMFKIKNILDTNPEAATYTGDVANMFMGMAANAEALTSLMPGYRASDVELDIEGNDWRAKMVGMGIANRELQAVLFSIAIQNAVAEGMLQGRLTNKMLDLSLRQVGAGERNPAAIKARLREVRDKMVAAVGGAIDFQLDNYTGADQPAPFSADELTPEEKAELDAYRKAAARE